MGKDAILMDMAKPQTFQRLETPEELEEMTRQEEEEDGE